MAAALPMMLSVFSTAIGGISSIMAANQQAASQRAAAQAQANAYQINAQIADQNAIAAQQAKNVEAEDLARKDRYKLSQKKVAYLKGGVTLDGSPLMVLEEDAATASVDQQRIRHEGAVQASNYRNQATQQRYQAQTALVIGNNQASTSIASGYRSLIK